MYLYNVIFGNYSIAPDDWSHIVDEHGNHFIAKDDIRQRMRLDKSIQPVDYPEEGNLPMLWKASNMQCYHLLPNVKWVNNNKNMNPLLLNSKQINVSEDDEQVVVYITVQANYHITRFSTKHRILQTYHKKDVLQGCAVILNVKDMKNEDFKTILTFSAYDDKKKDFAQFTVESLPEDPAKIITKRKAITDKKTKDQMNQQIQKYKNSYMGFKIRTKTGDLLTSLYVVSTDIPDEEMTKVKNIEKQINGFTYVLVDSQQYESDSSVQEHVFEVLKKEIEENRIRSITLVGMRLPLNVIKQLKLLYVFEYKVSEDQLICKKAN